MTANAGTLSAANHAWTLTMPARDVTISVRRRPTFPTAPAVRLTSDGGTDGYRDQDPDKLFDCLDNSKWCAAFDGTNWLEFHADEPVRPAAYGHDLPVVALIYIKRTYCCPV